MKNPAQTSWKDRLGRWKLRLKYSFYLAFILFAGLGIVGAFAEEVSPAPPGMGWINLQDADGINAWNYTLNLADPGFDIVAQISAFLIGLLWEFYRTIVMLAIWFVDWVLSFDWIGILITPLDGIGQDLQRVLARVEIAQSFLLITAVTVAFALMKGKYATALYEMIATGVILALSTGMLAHPTTFIAGDDGIIHKTRDYTMQFVEEMDKEQRNSGQELMTGDEGRKKITSLMVKVFIRVPSEVISYGSPDDGTLISCRKKFNESMKGLEEEKESFGEGKLSGLGRFFESLADMPDECKELQKKAAKPSVQVLGAVVVLYPSAFVLLGLVVILCGLVILKLVDVGICGIKLIIDLIKGLLPGGSRHSLAVSTSDVLFNLLFFAASILFLLVIVKIVEQIYANNSSLMKAFVVTDIALIVGIFVYQKFKNKIQEASSRLAEALSRRPDGRTPRSSGSSSSAIPQLLAGGYAAKQVVSGVGSVARFGGRAVKASWKTGVATGRFSKRVAEKVRERKAQKVEGENPASQDSPASEEQVKTDPAENSESFVNVRGNLPRRPTPEQDPAEKSKRKLPREKDHRGRIRLLNNPLGGVKWRKRNRPNEELKKGGSQKVRNPKAESPKVGNPKVRNPKAESPKVRNPKAESPKVRNWNIPPRRDHGRSKRNQGR